MQLLFYPLLLMIIGAVTVSSFDGAGETFILIMDAILLGIVLVWIFAFKAYLLIIPVVFIIQCVEQREDECMSWCVSDDGANYNECLLSVCDFPI